jgi:adenosine/AMP kinase
MGYPDPCQRLKGRTTVKHDASAASNGTALRLIRSGSEYRLISENLNNADSSFSIAVTGPDGKTGETAIVPVYDVAAGTGVAVFVDDDFPDPARRLIAIVPTLGDAFVEATNGSTIQIRYVAATTTGVAVYFDDDGSNATQRLLAVTPGAANATVETSNERCNVFAIPGA